MACRQYGPGTGPPYRFVATAGAGQRTPSGLSGTAKRGQVPYAAVVELHGCNGSEASGVARADVLKSFGNVALALGSLGDFQHLHRGYISDGGLAEHFDACAVLDWLAKQSCVDADQVALLGFSMGAQATLDAVKPGFIENKKQRHFRAAIAYYPWCRDCEV